MDDVVKPGPAGLVNFETRARMPEGILDAPRAGLAWLRWVPADVWIRAGLLLGALSLIKVVILFALRKHLFEIHWRVTGFPPTWIDTASFYTFAVLVGLNLWLLAKRCVGGGAVVVRVANAWVLLLGVVFIIMTFHQGEQTYLLMLMTGVLGLKNILAYLNLDFFFHPPYLAAWIGGYAFAYYVLVRTRREPLALFLTAVTATAFTLLCLGDLVQYSAALLCADCIGIAGLIAAQRSNRGLTSLTWAIVGGCLAFGFLFFQSFAGAIRFPEPGFLILLGGGAVLFLGATVFAWRGRYWSGWSAGLPFAFVAFLLLLSANFPRAENYQNLLCWGLALPHYFLGEIGLSVALFLIAVVYRKLRPAGSLWWMDVIIVLLLAVALLDLRLTQIMNVRLDWQVVSAAYNPKMMWRMSRPYLPAVSAGLVVLICAYAWLVWAVKRRWAANVAPEDKPSRGGAVFFAVCLPLLGLAGLHFANPDKAEGQTAVLLTETSPLWKRTSEPMMDSAAFASTARQLGMDPTVTPEPAPVTTHQGRDWNVVLILQESTYNQYLSLFDGAEDTEPALAKYKDRMEVFPNFYSDFASSIHARFATFTGLYPVVDFNEFTLKRVPVKSIFDVLSDDGYHCSLFYSSFLDYTGFRDFLRGRGIEAMYDADTMPGQRTTEPVGWGIHEEETLHAMQAQIRDYAAKKTKFFMTYVPAAPHNPFDGTPVRFRRHRAVQLGDFTPLYINELLYVDSVMASVVDQLKESGLLDNTLVIITADHGEMLGANGGPVGHGWALTPELANVPLMVLNPDHNGYRVNNTVGSQVDLLPTILDLLHLPEPAHQFYQGVSLYSAAAQGERTIYLNTYRQYGILHGGEFICGDRKMEASHAGTGSQDFYLFANDGARTSYTRTNEVDGPSLGIGAFDKFQIGLLQHYADYCRVLSDVKTASR